jgi:transglutaminase-like putative cysteine protease
MLIRIGYELVYEFPQPTPMILNLNVHYSRSSDLVESDQIHADARIRDSGVIEPSFPYAFEHTVESLPYDTLEYLLPSRYCETERLSDTAWRLFGGMAPGWGRVQAICDFVHRHIAFHYQYARPTKTAWEAFQEGQGVCRDFAHLAIAFCRCMNIPARYCTGYLGDMGTPPPYGPMDFAGWFEAYLGGSWHTFDPRNNQRRIGRVLIARGRDAADVAISMTFGPNTLQSFRVWTDEVQAAAA